MPERLIRQVQLPDRGGLFKAGASPCQEPVQCGFFYLVKKRLPDDLLPFLSPHIGSETVLQIRSPSFPFWIIRKTNPTSLNLQEISL